MKRNKIDVPNLKMSEIKNNLTPLFHKYNSPILQFGGNMVACLIKNKADGKTRVAKINKEDRRWSITNLRAKISFLNVYSGPLDINKYKIALFKENMVLLDKLIKDKSNYDEFALPLKNLICR